MPGGILGVLAAAAAGLVLVMAVLYLVYAVRLGNLEEDVADLDGQISDRQERVAELQSFGDLQASLEMKKPVADGIYRTRFAWDEFLEGLAFVTPDATSLESFEAQAAPVDVDAGSGDVLEPGSISFSGLSLADYRNVADFVVQMNALRYLDASELQSADLDRETYEEPAITFEASSRLVTRVGEDGDEVPIGDGEGNGGEDGS